MFLLTTRRFFNLLGILIFLTGCRYQLLDSNDRASIEVCYQGKFATPTLKDHLALALKRSTASKIVPNHGRYELLIEMTRLRREDIGYLHDREPLTGHLLNRLFPNEGRVLLEGTISIVDKQDLNRMIGHRSFSVSSDFDFTNPNTLRDTSYNGTPLVEYSLGQFDAESGAYDVALSLVEKRFAEQVALFVGSVCQKK